MPHCALCVTREMATTFARLCQQVDQTQKELEAEIRQLTAKIDQLESIQSRSKSLRSVQLPLLSGITGKVKCLSGNLSGTSVGNVNVSDQMNDNSNWKRVVEFYMTDNTKYYLNPRR